MPTGNAGAPGDAATPCGSCHRVTVNPSGGKVEVIFPNGLTWQAGQTQSWTVKITDPDTTHAHGFQLTTRPVGTLTAPSGSSTSVASGYINHTASKTTYTFTWSPTSSSVGDVVVYVAALGTKGTNNGSLWTATYTLSQASTNAPTSSAIVNGASFAANIAPGTWTTIYGTNLSGTGVSRVWTADDIVAGALPTTLEGVSVKINNKPAAIYYASPTQLNVLAPNDTATGTVNVQVTTPAGTVTGTTTLAAVAPALFCFDPQSRRYPAALSTSYETIAPSGLFGTALTTRAAKPGETILLYGTGFGTTNPAVSSSTAFSGAAPLADITNLKVTVGGVQATVAFAGLTSPGLYQLNIVVPDVSDGEHELKAALGSVSTQSGVYLAVQR